MEKFTLIILTISNWKLFGYCIAIAAVGTIVVLIVINLGRSSRKKEIAESSKAHDQFMEASEKITTISQLLKLSDEDEGLYPPAIVGSVADKVFRKELGTLSFDDLFGLMNRFVKPSEKETEQAIAGAFHYIFERTEKIVFQQIIEKHSSDITQEQHLKNWIKQLAIVETFCTLCLAEKIAAPFIKIVDEEMRSARILLDEYKVEHAESYIYSVGHGDLAKMVPVLQLIQEMYSSYAQKNSLSYFMGTLRQLNKNDGSIFNSQESVAEIKQAASLCTILITGNDKGFDGQWNRQYLPLTELFKKLIEDKAVA